MVERRPHRLERELYRGDAHCAFTICVNDKRSLFVDDELFKVFQVYLLEVLEKNQCDAHVYLFMPDHVHLLLSGNNETADLWQCIVDFKQKTGYWLARSDKQIKWQHDFFDHLLRKDDDVEKHITYILENPIRADLVRDWKEYPYKGSTLYSFENW